MRLRNSTVADGPRVMDIWRRAVDATHDFLIPEDRVAIEARRRVRSRLQCGRRGRVNIPTELQGVLTVVKQDALHEGAAGSRRHALETAKVSLRNRRGRLHFDADDLSCGILENEVNLELILVTIVKD